jgi:hypothetical protein
METEQQEMALHVHGLPPNDDDKQLRFHRAHAKANTGKDSTYLGRFQIQEAI